MKRLGSGKRSSLVVTYPEALAEKVVRKSYLIKNTIRLKRGEASSLDSINELLMDNDFERVDFVYEPGQLAIRGGIIDVFSFTNDYPYRIEFFGDEVETIRSFNPVDQLSIDKLDHITIVPNIQDRKIIERRESILSFIPTDSVIWMEDIKFTHDRIDFEYNKAKEIFENSEFEFDNLSHDDLFISAQEFKEQVLNFNIVETGTQTYFKDNSDFEYNIEPQPNFNKNFDLLISVVIMLRIMFMNPMNLTTIPGPLMQSNIYFSILPSCQILLPISQKILWRSTM